MRALLPTALLAVALLLGTLYGRPLLHAVRRHFSYPSYGLTALCPHCILPLPRPDSHVCPSCMLPVSGFAATDPILRVLSTGALFRQGSRRLVGAGLAGVSLLCAGTLVIVCFLWADGEREASIGALVTGSPWLIVSFKALSARHGPAGGA